MSPRLERALSEALEEELTQELEHILEPIMSRIKARVPAIIERCRLKLMSASQSPDCETESTPPAISARMVSEDNEHKIVKPMECQKSPTEYRCTKNSLEVVPFPEMLPGKAKRKRQQHSEPSTSDTSGEDRHDASSPASSTDLSMVYSDEPCQIPGMCGKVVDNTFDMEDSFSYTITGGYLGGGCALDPEDQPDSFANSSEMAFKPLTSVEDLLQQGNAYLATASVSIWRSPETTLDELGQSEGEKPGIDSCQVQESLPEWNALLEGFEFPGFF